MRRLGKRSARGAGLLLAALVWLPACGCEKSNPLVTEVNCQKLNGMKELKDVEAFFGPGAVASRPSSLGPDHAVGAAKWRRWYNGRADGAGHSLTLYVGLDEQDNICCWQTDLAK